MHGQQVKMTKKYSLTELGELTRSQNIVPFNNWLINEYDLHIGDLDSTTWAKYTKLWQTEVLDKV